MKAMPTPATTASTQATSRPRSSSRCSRSVISLSPGACASASSGLGVGAEGGSWVIAMGVCRVDGRAPTRLYEINVGVGSIDFGRSHSLRPAVIVQVVHCVLDGADLL